MVMGLECATLFGDQVRQSLISVSLASILVHGNWPGVCMFGDQVRQYLFSATLASILVCMFGEGGQSLISVSLASILVRRPSLGPS